MRDVGSESEMSAKVRHSEAETVLSVKGQRKKKKIYTMATDPKRKLLCFHMVLGEKESYLRKCNHRHMLCIGLISKFLLLQGLGIKNV